MPNISLVRKRNSQFNIIKTKCFINIYGVKDTSIINQIDLRNKKGLLYIIYSICWNRYALLSHILGKGQATDKFL